MANFNIRIDDTLKKQAEAIFSELRMLVGSQEGEINRLLSPSIYYGVCYAVEVILSLILCEFASVEMTR